MAPRCWGGCAQVGTAALTGSSRRLRTSALKLAPAVLLEKTPVVLAPTAGTVMISRIWGRRSFIGRVGSCSSMVSTVCHSEMLTCCGGNGSNVMGIDGNGSEWLECDGNRWEWRLGMAANGCEWLECDGNGLGIDWAWANPKSYQLPGPSSGTTSLTWVLPFQGIAWFTTRHTSVRLQRPSLTAKSPRISPPRTMPSWSRSGTVFTRPYCTRL